MEIGIFCPFSAATPPDLMGQAMVAIEDRDFHAIWLPEHVVMFPDYESRYPYHAGGKLAGFDNGMLEPWTGLAFAAAHTKRIRLGSSICLVPQRNPVYTAKQIADVDFLSGGRVNFGVGVGWLREEFDALQVPWAERGKRTREYIAVMQALWTQEVSEYRGELYTLPPCIQLPKPVQKPHPPIFFGGESDAALARVADLGQGWMGAGMLPDEMPERLSRLDRLLEARGRGRADVKIYLLPNRVVDAAMLEGYAALGVEQVIQLIVLRNIDDVQSRLDRLARMAFG